MTLPLESADYFIQYMKLPPKVWAMITPNDDSTFTMFLDPRRDFEQMLDDYEHELWHIIHDDFYNNETVQKIEGL